MAIGIFNISNFSAMQNLKKSLEEKNKERAKIYGYIGMETYELFKQGKVSIPEMDVYFENMKTLEEEIEALEKEKQQLEVQNKGNRVCSCGNVLSAKDRFCSNCGKALFQMEEPSGQDNSDYKECICGAKVQEGAFMCMECGRKINP